MRGRSSGTIWSVMEPLPSSESQEMEFAGARLVFDFRVVVDEAADAHCDRCAGDRAVLSGALWSRFRARNRKKWNSLAHAWYLISEWLSTKLPTRIVTDAREIERYYLERYGAASELGIARNGIRWRTPGI